MHGTVQSSQYRYDPSLHGTDEVETRHVWIAAYGQRANGLVSRFVVKRIDIDGFSADCEDALDSGEQVVFNFAGYGIVTATLQYVLGVEARFRFHSTLSRPDLEAIQRHGSVKSSGFRSVSCGVTPTFPAET